MKLFFNSFFIKSTIILSLVAYLLCMYFLLESHNLTFGWGNLVFGVIFTVACHSMPYKAAIADVPEPSVNTDPFPHNLRNEYGQTEAEYYEQQAELHYSGKHQGSIDLRK